MPTTLIKDSHFELLSDGIKPDAKTRLLLGKAAEIEGVTYHVYRNRLGQIVLDPHLSIPAHEAWIFKNKKALASLRRGLKQSAEGKTRDLGSFAKHAAI